MVKIFVVCCFLCALNLNAQDMNVDSLPYQEIPEYPSDFGPGNVVSRLIDGLGYRFYWASESLRALDLNYKPSEDAKTCLETIDHIYALSISILNATSNLENIRPIEPSIMDYDTLRSKSLFNLKLASDNMRDKDAESLEQLKIIFKRGDKTNSFPYWHMLNGQIADALYHTGQLVSFRRSSSNPLDMNVNVFTGKSRNQH